MVEWMKEMVSFAFCCVTFISKSISETNVENPLSTGGLIENSQQLEQMGKFAF